jgi:uncharacterized protein
MERKSVAFEIKAIDETEGIFEGYASTFTKTPDSYGDVIDKGAFKKTIKENRGRIKILWNHNADEPIGIPLELREDDTGLYVKGKLSLGVQRAREILALMKDEVVNTMSIGFRTVTEAMEGEVRHLKEVKLYDTSPVTFAANESALITSVKAVTPHDGTEITETIEYLQALLTQYDDQEPPSTPAVEGDEAAELEAVLSGINAEMSGFDAAEAETLLESAIARAGG